MNAFCYESQDLSKVQCDGHQHPLHLQTQISFKFRCLYVLKVKNGELLLNPEHSAWLSRSYLRGCCWVAPRWICFQCSQLLYTLVHSQRSCSEILWFVTAEPTVCVCGFMVKYKSWRFFTAAFISVFTEFKWISPAVCSSVEVLLKLWNWKHFDGICGS